MFKLYDIYSNRNIIDPKRRQQRETPIFFHTRPARLLIHFPPDGWQPHNRSPASPLSFFNLHTHCTPKSSPHPTPRQIDTHDLNLRLADRLPRPLVSAGRRQGRRLKDDVDHEAIRPHAAPHGPRLATQDGVWGPSESRRQRLLGRRRLGGAKQQALP